MDAGSIPRKLTTTGFEQAAGYHVDRPDGNNGRIGETGEKLIGWNQPQYANRNKHKQGYDVHAQLFRGEED